MVRAWILYSLLLLGSFAFFVFYSEYISFFLFAGVLLFPLFSLLLFLLGKRKLRLRFLPDSPVVQKGETCSFLLEVEKPFFLPLPSCKVKLTLHNTFSGEHLTQGMEFPLTSRRMQLFLPCVSSCCGRIVFSLSGCKVFDLTRLFFVTLPTPQTESAFILPYIPIYEPASTALSPTEGTEDTNPRRRGSDPSETFDLRFWRKGDRLRDIHWKLSARTGDTIVREHVSPMRPPIKLFIRFCGNAAERDGTLEAAAALGAAFCENGFPIEFLWEDASDEKNGKRLCSCFLQEREELIPCLEEILSSVPSEEGSLQDSLHSTEVQKAHIFLTGPIFHSSTEELEGFLPSFLPAEGVSPIILTVTEQKTPEEFSLRSSGFFLLYLHPERIEEGLRLFTLSPEGGNSL